MKRGQPLTLEEIKELADKWFPLFDEVHSRLPDQASRGHSQGDGAPL